MSFSHKQQTNAGKEGLWVLAWLSIPSTVFHSAVVVFSCFSFLIVTTTKEEGRKRHRDMTCMHVCLRSLSLPSFYSSHLQAGGLILFPRSYFLLFPPFSPSLVAPFTSRGGGCGGLRGDRPASLPYLYGY